MREYGPSEIRKIRDRLQMTQAAFAKAFRLNIRTVQKWEQGETKPEGPGAVLVRLIDLIPRAIMKALKEDNDRPGGNRT
jgi:putative transcriptional regulator